MFIEKQRSVHTSVRLTSGTSVTRCASSRLQSAPSFEMGTSERCYVWALTTNQQPRKNKAARVFLFSFSSLIKSTSNPHIRQLPFYQKRACLVGDDNSSKWSRHLVLQMYKRYSYKITVASHLRKCDARLSLRSTRVHCFGGHERYILLQCQTCHLIKTTQKEPARENAITQKAQKHRQHTHSCSSRQTIGARCKRPRTRSFFFFTGCHKKSWGVEGWALIDTTETK